MCTVDTIMSQQCAWHCYGLVTWCSFPLRGPGIQTLRLEAELLGCMLSIAIGIVSGHGVVDAREYIGVTKTDQSG